LITVKTYPLPSNKYGELVCTAGLLPDGKWIRLYPIQFRDLPYKLQYKKYRWITADLVRNYKDFRPESYRLKGDISKLVVGEEIDTKKCWEERKKYVYREVFESMHELIDLARGEEQKSLATLKPREIIDFVIEPEAERDWPEKWKELLLQYQLFDQDSQGEGRARQVIPKVPYKYYYKFYTRGDKRPRKLMVEDWEVGALYWNCLKSSKGDEEEANRQVKAKYFDQFCAKHDLSFFVGSTLEYHRRRMSNPFIIIGVFYPLKPKEIVSERPRMASDPLQSKDIAQRSLFDLPD
jgi:hypothetical protein